MKSRINCLLIVCFCFLSNLTFSQASSSDSILLPINSRYNEVSGLHRTFFGEGYRRIWSAPTNLKIFRLQGEKDTFAVVNLGGGLQTKSIRLKDLRGKEWVLRSIQKYPERALPEKLKPTIAKTILNDQVITMHPYASLTVPVLAQSLGISHARPQIVYVPESAELKESYAGLGNAVYLLEERASVDTLLTNTTDKIQQLLQKDNDNSVNQKLVLRARLLDILIGDWDRHEDQWRWIKTKGEDGSVYLPVPRDRDQAFYTTSGIFPWIVSHQYLKSKFQGFHKTIRDINGFNFNARYFDRFFLNGLSKADWEAEISFLERTLTDSVLAGAIHRLPPNIFQLSGEHIIQTLIARKKILRTEALKYYQFLSLSVDVPSSDKHELFDVNYLANGNISLKIFKQTKEGVLKQEIYDREFDASDTKEIRLYGLDGNDVFSVKGDATSPIKLRMVGGTGIDDFKVEGQVKRSLFVYDDVSEANKLPMKTQAKLFVSNDSLINAYNKKEFVYDRFNLLTVAGFNADQGLIIGTGFLSVKQGFRKYPYAQKHLLEAYYSVGRGSFLFRYAADFKEAVGKNDFTIAAESKGPKYVSNFFGIGNETEFPDEGTKKIDYYRNRYDIVTATTGLSRQLTRHTALNLGITGQYYTSKKENNLNHFLVEYDQNNAAENVFSKKYYIGLVAGKRIDTRNNLLQTSKGVYWNTSLKGMQGLNEEKQFFVQALSEFSFYLPLSKALTTVFANRIGAGTIFGDAPFFQQMQLGGPQNLRGFNTARFTGKSMLYHNAELRLKLFDFTSYILPGSVGLIAFNDIGRVWTPKESSTKWHHGYGGGFYIIPADLILIQAVLGNSEERLQPYISIGFRF